MPVEAALEVTPGIAIKVVDENDVAVFDSSNRINGIPNATSSLEPKDASKVALAKIVVDDKVVGSVRIWVYGSDTLMRGPDQEFRENSYQAMLFASLVAIVLASCIGFLFARNLVAPINRMTKTARAIKEGDLSARTDLHGEDEIARLGETFDEMAESVEKDRELERRLTTDVAHELRTPLMAIQSTVEAMVDGVFEADAERLETVNSEVQRLSRLVDALLKLSRLENRATPMKEEVVDVGELIQSIVSTHEAFVADSGLTFEYRAEKGVLVVGDPDMIRQATANLILERGALHPRRRACVGHRVEGRHHGLDRRTRHRHRAFPRGGEDGLLALLEGGRRAQPRERRLRHRACGREGNRRSPWRLGAGRGREGQRRLLHAPFSPLRRAAHAHQRQARATKAAPAAKAAAPPAVALGRPPATLGRRKIRFQSQKVRQCAIMGRDSLSLVGARGTCSRAAYSQRGFERT